MNVVEISLIVFAVDLALISSLVGWSGVFDDEAPVVGPTVVFDADPDVGHERKQTDCHRMNVAESSPRDLQSSRHQASLPKCMTSCVYYTYIDIN
jgi:hypothetical protein